jgi:hypothetical protein
MNDTWDWYWVGDSQFSFNFYSESIQFFCEFLWVRVDMIDDYKKKTVYA